MTTTDNRPDLAAFIAEVRAHLADLSADERDELLDGLEADLADQLADGATHLLDDPASYAAELRAAAGLPLEPRRRRLAAPTSGWPGRALDASRAWWLRQVGRSGLSRQAWSVAQALRPAWWALRAWVAVTMLDVVTGHSEAISLIPSRGITGLGLLGLVVAVGVSALIGLGRLWPGAGPARRTTSRVVLIVLNVVAVALAIGLANTSRNDARFGDGAFTGYAQSAPVSRGVIVGGRAVHNIYAYDAQGQPLTGVQLFDGAGRPIALSPDQAASAGYGSPTRVVGCPWVNGTRRLFNVFPLPERPQRQGVCRESLDGKLGPGVLPAPPLAQVPPVVLPAATP